MRNLSMAVSALRLIGRLFIIIDAKPIQAAKNRINRLLCGALLIGVFNPQQRLSAVMAGIKPIE